MSEYLTLTISEGHMRKMMERQLGSAELAVSHVRELSYVTSPNKRGFEITFRERKPKEPKQCL